MFSGLVYLDFNCVDENELQEGHTDGWLLLCRSHNVKNTLSSSILVDGNFWFCCNVWLCEVITGQWQFFASKMIG